MAPLAPPLAAAAAGVVVDRFASPWGMPAWAAIALGLGGVAVLAGGRRWVGQLAMLGALLALAGAWHHQRWSGLPADDLARSAAEAPRPAWVRGVVDDAPAFRPGSGGASGVTRLTLALSAVHDRGRWRPASGRALVSVPGDRTDLPAGGEVEAAGGLALPARALNPGQFDDREYLRAQGVRLRLSADHPSGVWAVGRPGAWPWTRRGPGRLSSSLLGSVRAWSRSRLERGLDPSVAPLASALLLGRREGVDPELNEAFARTGTTHLLAISGLHMQALALALGLSLRALGLGRRPTFAGVGLATLAYALLVGLTPSVVRSAAMTLTVCGAGLSDRCARAGNTLAVAGLVTLALNPSNLFDVGCQLSFLAVGAIVWVAGPLAARLGRVRFRKADPLEAVERHFEPAWKQRARRALGWAARAVLTGAVISAVVWLAALPLVALRFHLVSPVGVLLNIPLVPLTTLALFASGLSLGLSAVWTPLGAPAAWVNARLLGATERTVRWGAAQDWGYAFVPGPTAAWAVAFYALLFWAVAARVGRWRGRGWASVSLAAWSAFGLLGARVPGPGGPPEAEVLAVGHGLAVAVYTGPGRATLYDCGRARDPSVGRRVVAPTLWARGVRRLDAVVLSHADADHYNGLPDLLDRFKIGALLVPEGFAGPTNPGASSLLDDARARGVPVRTVAAGDAWTSGPTRFAILHPPRGWNPSAPDNARSVVLDVSWQGRHALLTGDLDGPGLAAVTAAPPPAPLDVFLSPHHGGQTANPPRLYDWAGAAVVVVSQRPPIAGTRDALAFLDRPPRSTPLLRTWHRGAVRLRWRPGGIEASGFLDDLGPGGGPD